MSLLTIIEYRINDGDPAIIIPLTSKIIDILPVIFHSVSAFIMLPLDRKVMFRAELLSWIAVPLSNSSTPVLWTMEQFDMACSSSAL